MRKINSVTLETMKRELVCLDQIQCQSIKGGIIYENWACVFNAIEDIGKTLGVNHDAQYYYNSFMNNDNYDYDPKTILGWNPQHSDPSNPTTGRDEAEYEGIRREDLRSAINSFGFNIYDANLENIDGTQMMLLSKDNGNLHAVVAEEYLDSGKVAWRDPQTGQTGIEDPGKNGVYIYDISRRN